MEAICNQGLTVKLCLTGDFTLPVKATGDPGEVVPVELVLFCVKAYDTITAAEQIRPLVGQDSVILSVQNGIDNEEQIGKVVRNESVVGAAAYVSSVIEAPGVIAQTAGPGRIVFGELAGGMSSLTERLLSTFQRAGIAADLRPDIHITLLNKFLFICAISGITALTRLPIRPILACPETRALYRGTMEGVEVVARTGGITLSDKCVDQKLAFTAGLEASM